MGSHAMLVAALKDTQPVNCGIEVGFHLSDTGAVDHKLAVAARAWDIILSANGYNTVIDYFIVMCYTYHDLSVSSSLGHERGSDFHNCYGAAVFISFIVFRRMYV